MIGLEPAQTGVDPVQDMVSGRTRVIWPAAHARSDLGRKKYFGPSSRIPKVPANDRFRVAAGIRICRVYVINSCVEGDSQQLTTCGFVGTMWVAKVVGSVGNLRDANSSPAKLYVFHLLRS
jgi:hypothetical protein